MEKENSQGEFQVNWNGKELTGDQAKEFVKQMFDKLAPNLTGSLGTVLKTVTQNLKGGSLPTNAIKNMADLNALSKMLPVFDISKDLSKMKMTLNGKTLFDLDLSNAVNHSDDSSNKS